MRRRIHDFATRWFCTLPASSTPTKGPISFAVIHKPYVSPFKGRSPVVAKILVFEA